MEVDMEESSQGRKKEFVADTSPKCAIPVGPRFQVDVPEWTDPPDLIAFLISYNESTDSSIWLGHRNWPPTNVNPEAAVGNIGEGRPDICQCRERGSTGCAKKHLSEKRAQLKSELKFNLFYHWGFPMMGEAASMTWTEWEQKEFEILVRNNPLSRGKSFLDPAAVVNFTTKTRQEMINYYFDVYLPRKMSIQSRSGNKIVDTDNEGGEEERPARTSSRGRGRRRANVVQRRGFLTGRR